MDTDVKAAILVGGKSKRLGENKSFLRFGDAYLLDVIISRVRSVFSDTYLITNPSFPSQDFPLPFFTDTYADKGPLGGIFTALSEIDAPFIFVTAGDMPFIDPELIRYMARQRSAEHDAIVPEHGGKREPLFAVYNRNAKGTIEEALQKGMLSVHEVLRHLSVHTVDEGTLGSFGEHVFFNINTSADYQRALRIWNHVRN